MWRNELGAEKYENLFQNLHKAFFINLFVSPSNKISLFGEVTEWSKVLAWKVSVPQKGTKGSNPFLSAQTYGTEILSLYIKTI